MNNFSEIFKKYAAVVFFDTETSGLDYENCQIIELAAIRVQPLANGKLRMAPCRDLFVKLPEGQKIPENIVQLTGITDEMLENEGVAETEAAAIFTDIISNKEGPVLLVAHNAQFDLLFTRKLLWKYTGDGEEMFESADYLDTLTVYKDRRPYPHKLADAITAYKLEDKVQNSHRAIDDVFALIEVFMAMNDERADLHTYVNMFGFNPKYGVSGYRLDRVTYWPQNFNHCMMPSRYTLPALIRRGKK